MLVLFRKQTEYVDTKQMTAVMGCYVHLLSVTHAAVSWVPFHSIWCRTPGLLRWAGRVHATAESRCSDWCSPGESLTLRRVLHKKQERLLLCQFNMLSWPPITTIYFKVMRLWMDWLWDLILRILYFLCIRLFVVRLPNQLMYLYLNTLLMKC